MGARKKAAVRATPGRVHERLARLETIAETQATALAQMSTSLDEMKSALQKYKGFWGAITLILSALVALFELIKDPVFKKLGWID